MLLSITAESVKLRLVFLCVAFTTPFVIHLALMMNFGGLVDTSLRAVYLIIVAVAMAFWSHNLWQVFDDRDWSMVEIAQRRYSKYGYARIGLNSINYKNYQLPPDAWLRVLLPYRPDVIQDLETNLRHLLYSSALLLSSTIAIVIHVLLK